MSETAQQWLATLSEVRRQAARAAVLAGVQPPESDGQWYDVAEDRTETSDLETLDETGAWRGLQWLNAFEILFFERPKELMTGEQQDDLLFFVVHAAYQADGASLLVRRKGRAMPAELGRGGEQAEHIDWRKSVLLNLVIQATYCLTVATCRRTDISELLQQNLPIPAEAARVSKAVYASPMSIQVDIEGQRSKEDQPSVGYPDICFAIEDFDDAFKGLIVSEPGWCYVVTLSALSGPAIAALLPPPQYLQAGPISQSPVAIPQQSQQAKPADVALKQESQSTSRASVSQPFAQRSPEIQRDAAADATTQGQSHSAAVSAPADSGSQHEHAVHDVSAGMSLSSEGQQPQQAHGVGTAADRTGASRSSAYSGIDDPLRRPARNDVEAQHGSQVPVSALVDSSNACENSLPASEHGRSESGVNSAAASGQQAPHSARNAAQQVGQAVAQGNVDLPLFTGFVSHEQLEAVIGNNSYERRLASKKELTHWVKMRGPGGQGHADVAVTCLLPLDEGHLKPPAEDLQKSSRPAGKGGSSFQRVFNSVAASAAEAAKGFVKDIIGRDQGFDEYVRLRCALMRLSLPVELLAAQLLQLPLQDIVPDM